MVKGMIEKVARLIPQIREHDALFRKFQGCVLIVDDVQGSVCSLTMI